MNTSGGRTVICRERRDYGHQASDLHGLPRHDAGRSARGRGDAAVLHASTSATRRAATIRSAGKPRKRSTRPASRSADLIGANAKEIVFTSGATESNNLAIKGVAEMYREKGNHIITAVTEHKAVLDTCKRLEKDGYRVTYLPVQKDGLINLDELRARDHRQDDPHLDHDGQQRDRRRPADRGDRRDREGEGHPVPHRRRAGRRQDSVQRERAEASTCVSLSAHKMYGPKGVGALYVRRRNPRVLLSPQIDGGGHERGMRSGTLNVPGIVGFGKARGTRQGRKWPTESQRLRGLARPPERPAAQGARRDLHQRLDGAPPAAQPQHQLRLCRRRIAADGHQRRRGVVGFGCTSASLEPSYVLKALAPATTSPPSSSARLIVLLVCR